MRTRSSKIRSLIIGIAILVIAATGFLLTSRLAVAGGRLGSPSAMNLFRLAWVAIGLIGAGLSFYNALDRQPAVPYETDGDVYTIDSPTGSVCPKCGKAVSDSDRFCRNCGAYLRA